MKRHSFYLKPGEKKRVKEALARKRSRIVITLGPGNIDLSLAANIGLASAVSMTVMNGSDAGIGLGLVAAAGCGLAIGAANYLSILAAAISPSSPRCPPASSSNRSISPMGAGCRSSPPPGFADFTSLQIAGLPLLAVFALLLRGAAVLLRRTIYGRSVLAIGQNILAARLAGVAAGVFAPSPIWCAACWAD